MKRRVWSLHEGKIFSAWLLLISDYQFLLLIPIRTQTSIICECTHVHLVFMVNVFAHFGTCMCLCKSTLMVLCLCKYVLRTDWPGPYMSPLIALYLMFSDRISYLTWFLLNQLSWLATEFHRTFSLLDYTHYYLDRIMIWYWTLRLKFSWCITSILPNEPFSSCEMPF